MSEKDEWKHKSLTYRHQGKDSEHSPLPPVTDSSHSGNADSATSPEEQISEPHKDKNAERTIGLFSSKLGIDKGDARSIYNAGYTDILRLKKSSIYELSKIDGLDWNTAKDIFDKALKIPIETPKAPKMSYPWEKNDAQEGKDDLSRKGGDEEEFPVPSGENDEEFPEPPSETDENVQIPHPEEAIATPMDDNAKRAIRLFERKLEITNDLARKMYLAGFTTFSALKATAPSDLTKIDGIDDMSAE